ncbi:MAG: arginine repressor [Ruminococcus sp.]|nr:arginine repressor [Ruminococcus sp.]
MKNKRQEKIIQLCLNEDIQTQEELCSKLAAAGFEVTQATVSRDIKELALIKVKDASDKTKYSVPQLKREAIGEDGAQRLTIISDSVNDVDCAQNTVVVKCTAGMAQAVCTKLDSLNIHNAVGTIAGDDTIFVLMRTERDAQRLVKELETIIKGTSGAVK